MTTLTRLPMVAAFAAAVATQAACQPDDKAFWLPKYDRSLDAAVAQAQATLPIFWRHVDGDSKIEQPSVKVPFRTAHGGTEFLWIFVDSHSSDAVRGQIGNEPEDVPGVHAGQPYVGKISDVVDWTYYKDDKGYGQYTSRELVKQGAFREQSGDLSPAPLELGDR